MNEFYIFAGNHPIVTVILAWAISGAVAAPFKYAYLAYSRHLRSANIRDRGWPTAPLMDADGDIVHPKAGN